MSSKVTKIGSFEYNPEKRLKDIKQKIMNGMAEEVCNRVMTDTSAYSTSNNVTKGYNEWLNELTNIGRNIEVLNSSVEGIRRNVELNASKGTEKGFLLYEDQCLKLLERLDKMVDNNDVKYSGLREQKLQHIQEIKKCTDQLRKSSIQNLSQLLSIVKPFDVHNSYEELYAKIETIIRPGVSPTIREVDDLRDQLEDIRQKFDI